MLSVTQATGVAGDNVFGIPPSVANGSNVRLERVSITFALSSPVAVQLYCFDPMSKAVVKATRYAILANGVRTLTLKPPRSILPFTAAAGEDFWGFRCSATVPYVCNNVWSIVVGLMPTPSFLGFGATVEQTNSLGGYAGRVLRPLELETTDDE